MRVLLSFLAVGLVAACGPADAPPDPVENVSEGPVEEVMPPPEPEPEEVLESEVNPLVGLLEQDIPYGEGASGNLVGFLAVPDDAAEPLPGIIVLHEWWGLNDGIREVARRLAREGYVVLAADLYAGRTAESVAEAQALMRELVADPDGVRDNIRQAYDYLDVYALAPRIGSIGWDMGGRWSLQTALMLPEDLDAIVMFYGAVETDEAALGAIDMPLLGLFGEQDASIPLRNVQDFRNVLGRLDKDAEVRIYSGVDHGFFFPGDPNYSPIAADDAWIRTIALFEAALKN